MNSFNAVILAGGYSSRMGVDKAELLFRNETLLARAKRIATNAGAETVYVSRASHKSSDFPDLFPNSGPLGGIHAALNHNCTLPMLVIPVDLPLLDCDSLISLVEHAYKKQRISYFKSQFIPILIWQPTSLIQSMEDSLRDGQNLSLRAFFNDYPRVEVELTNSLALENANTPEEWQAILDKASRLKL